MPLPSSRGRGSLQRRMSPEATNLDVNTPFSRLDGRRVGDEGRLPLRLSYVLQRIGLFLAVVWAAATLNFFLPRISGQDPVREKLMQQAASSGYVQSGMDQMVEEYQREFGLDQPLWKQYLTYLGNVARSISAIRSRTTRARWSSSSAAPCPGRSACC